MRRGIVPHAEYIADENVQQLAANTHPDHDTLTAFRKCFARPIEKLFVQVLLIAREMKLVKRSGTALGGTKVKAVNASKH